jgi:exodeoxyribonuclease-3
VWTSQALKGAVKSHEILSDARDWDRPSDHVPIVIELKV